MQKLLTLSNFTDISEKNQIVIIKVGADWCSPCKAISPLYNEINTSDADDELLDFINVKSLPTFLIYKNKELTNTIIGCDKLTLSECLNNL